MREFDLIIVGSGSGNSILTEEYQDLNVAIVEPGTFGGTCLNVGCIPTKMYVYPATVARILSFGTYWRAASRQMTRFSRRSVLRADIVHPLSGFDATVRRR